jgi:hypothetical protein
MKLELKILAGGLVGLVLAAGISAGIQGELFQGAFKTKTVPTLPDLVPALEETAFTMTGEVWLDATGEVFAAAVVINEVCGISNANSVTAAGTNYNYCNFTYGSGGFGTLRLAGELDLGGGETAAFTETVELDAAYGHYKDFYQELRDKGTASLTVEHQVDYALTSTIAESDETNNTALQTIIVNDAGLTWVTK